MKKMLMVVASAAMLVVPFAGPAAADDAEVCEAGVHVHEDPSVGLIYVETGQYEPYQTCVADPFVIIDHAPICLTKPSVCV